MQAEWFPFQPKPNQHLISLFSCLLIYPNCVSYYISVDAENLVQKLPGYIHETKMHHELLNAKLTSGYL